MSSITIRKFDVSRDIDDLIRLWSDQNIDVWTEFVSVPLARTHMLDMSHGFDDIGGLDLVAEEDGQVVAIGWAATFNRPLLRGKVVMNAIGLDSGRKDDVQFFNKIVEEMLKFARSEIHGDENLGKFFKIDDPDIRALQEPPR